MSQSELKLNSTCPISPHYRGMAIEDMIKDDKARGFLLWCAKKEILKFNNKVIEELEKYA